MLFILSVALLNLSSIYADTITNQTVGNLTANGTHSITENITNSTTSSLNNSGVAKNITNAVNIKLTTLLIGNGFYNSTIRSNTNFGDPSVNTYDLNLSDSVRDPYDIRELYPDPFPYSYFIGYLNTPTVQSAIGAYQNYTEISPSVIFTSDNVDAIGDMKKLLQRGVTIVMYHGDADSVCD